MLNKGVDHGYLFYLLNLLSIYVGKVTKFGIMQTQSIKSKVGKKGKNNRKNSYVHKLNLNYCQLSQG